MKNNSKDLEMLIQQMHKNLGDLSDFFKMVIRNLSGVDEFFKTEQVAVIVQANSKFLEFNVEDMTFETYITCLEQQISLQDTPEKYVGLVKLSKDFLLETTLV